MHHGGLVAGIADGDPAAFAAAYDQYAPGLYAYSVSVLGDPAGAAEAVQDTFIVASLRLSGLHDTSRLRSWLYAVARNECRRLRYEQGAAPLGARAGETGDDTADFGESLEQAAQREMVLSVLDGLSDADRDIVELTLRHEFYGAELADALGVPRNQAHALTTRGRAQFETALGALLVSHSGQGSCAELAQILSSWDGELTPAIRRQVRRHIDSCPGCAGQYRREITPVALLGTLPVPLLPAGLRSRVLGFLSDGSAEAVAARVEVAQRAEPFARSGFPVPLDPVAPARGPMTLMPAAAVVLAVFTLFGGGAYLAANTLHHSPQPVQSGLSPALALPSAQPAPSAIPPPAGAGGSQRHSLAGSVPIGVVGSLAALPSPVLTSSAPGRARASAAAPGRSASSSAKPGRTSSPRPTTPKPTRTSTAAPTTPSTPAPTTPVPTTPVPTTPVPTTPVPTTPAPTTPAPTTPAPTTPAPTTPAPTTPVPTTPAPTPAPTPATTRIIAAGAA
jgi:RNA polymerase sigma factor (sigma-70 family)